MHPQYQTSRVWVCSVSFIQGKAQPGAQRLVLAKVQFGNSREVTSRFYHLKMPQFSGAFHVPLQTPIGLRVNFNLLEEG